jgi:hypothetical protein
MEDMAMNSINDNIGKYGRMHEGFLKNHRKVLYMELLTQGTLYEYLVEIDRTAKLRVDLIAARIAENNGVDEKLKSQDQMKWVGLMNNAIHCAEEIVLRDLIFS